MTAWNILPNHDATGQLIDVTAQSGERQIRMLGAAGAERELALFSAPAIQESLAEGRGLPVLLGAGMGHALQRLLEKTTTPLAVIDADPEVLQLTAVQDRFKDTRITWFCSDRHLPNTQETLLKQLTQWQEEHGNKPFMPLIHPWYMRIDREWYGAVRKMLEASARYDFWGKAVHARFQSSKPRLLLITSKYFLMGEIETACQRLGLPVYLLQVDNKEEAQDDFVRRLLSIVVDFKPDCALTLNHLGIDREGVLIHLLERLQLPLASWFVDNPNLILHLYAKLASPWTSIFTWDADNVDGLKEQGFPHVHYLPLGTDPIRFCPRKPQERPSVLPTNMQVCFVGNSMVHKVAQRMRKTKLPAALLRGYRRVAAAYSASNERSVRAFVLGQKDLAEHYNSLPDLEACLAYETLLTWEATRQYRLSCVEPLLDFNPLIVGDTGWNTLFRNTTKTWRRHHEVSYYDMLPYVYAFSAINFNCTSQQMKGAVNQRIFDAPAANGFVLTDWREQMDQLFEPNQEVICYHSPEEVPELIRYYLKNTQERENITKAARRRVLSSHTWDCRILEILQVMKKIYG